MIKISKYERAELERVGLLRSRQVGYNTCDANYTVVNREHLSRSKKTYVTEEPEIMLFLGKYQGLNLQRVLYSQIKQLKEKGILNDDNIQLWGKYVPNALAFQDAFGKWRVKKVAKIMLELGIWTNNKTKQKSNTPKELSLEEVFSDSNLNNED